MIIDLQPPIEYFTMSDINVYGLLFLTMTFNIYIMQNVCEFAFMQWVFDNGYYSWLVLFMAFFIHNFLRMDHLHDVWSALTQLIFYNDWYWIMMSFVLNNVLKRSNTWIAVINWSFFLKGWGEKCIVAWKCPHIWWCTYLIQHVCFAFEIHCSNLF